MGRTYQKSTCVPFSRSSYKKRDMLSSPLLSEQGSGDLVSPTTQHMEVWIPCIPLGKCPQQRNHW